MMVQKGDVLILREIDGDEVIEEIVTDVTIKYDNILFRTENFNYDLTNFYEILDVKRPISVDFVFNRQICGCCEEIFSIQVGDTLIETNTSDPKELVKMVLDSIGYTTKITENGK